MAKKKDVVEAETPTTVANETNPEKAPTLLWNERGMIGCTLPGHAPHKGSDTWRFEHWKKIPAGATKEDGSPLACELCARGEGKPVEPAPDAQPAEEPPKKKGRKGKGDLTLSDLAGRYLAHMEDKGKSAGTVFSYRLELQTALAALGADTKIADLTSKDVAVFFGSAKVNKTRTGRPKSPLSIAKTQRVLRLALVWAVDAKLIEKAPLPEDLATH